ncbi:hypothetical protein MEM_05640 [Candida albicans L26]|uniref:Uncharacterized protein n=1 Tax=Candida albicans P78048 TaxID=1094989 RepID=A0AB34PKI7_CANAX|nr:hypothetical protein MEU_05628 [Candida albicans P37005]KGR04522.1 hypothetical protein MG3_05651 [Candida albicans P78048]KGR06564.1 hypothetical protein MG9_05645 [Candida albicans P37037]KGT64378.1 hypothetical protein MEK_05635 [Candida albicans 12C]KGU02113.1 hypothetical protein MEQ_05583 [Candida albicans P87]KGU03354.1 hypothetical protein MEM_05640 [Candida albicans L26]KGU03619.1 hypothetical protein MEY_05590 [Candida albicans 19F]KHC46362.1 hypothetical protein MGC_05614 [Cand
MYLVLKGGPTIYTKKFGTSKFFVEFLCVSVVVVAVVPMGGDEGKGRTPETKNNSIQFFLIRQSPRANSNFNPQSPIKYKPQSSQEKYQPGNFILYFSPSFFLYSSF